MHHARRTYVHLPEMHLHHTLQLPFSSSIARFPAFDWLTAHPGRKGGGEVIPPSKHGALIEERKRRGVGALKRNVMPDAGADADAGAAADAGEGVAYDSYEYDDADAGADTYEYDDDKTRNMGRSVDDDDDGYDLEKLVLPQAGTQPLPKRQAAARSATAAATAEEDDEDAAEGMEYYYDDEPVADRRSGETLADSADSFPARDKDTASALSLSRLQVERPARGAADQQGAESDEGSAESDEARVLEEAGVAAAYYDEDDTGEEVEEEDNTDDVEARTGGNDNW